MNTRQKLIWSLGYVGLFVLVALMGRHAISANEVTVGSAGAPGHSAVNWNAMQAEPDPSPRSVAAYGFEGR